MSERNIRIPISINSGEKQVRVNLENEFDNLEILTLKITSSETYNRHCSDFGVIAGRVVLNNGFGVQNAKVNIFIPLTEDDKLRNDILEIYPFETINDTFSNGLRYNLLPRVRNGFNKSHRAVGSLPNESDFTHYPQYVEVYEKYYKYTTVTNNSGDFLIFGVPTGQHDIIMDFDVFDTNSFEITANDLVDMLTLNTSIEELKNLINTNATDRINNNLDRNKVPNFIYVGDNNYEVEVKNNIDEMPNIFHQKKQITVSPFWGDDDFCDVGITRCDFTINFNFTPTAIFFGYLHTTTHAYSITADYKYTTQNRHSEIYAFDKSLGYNTGDYFPLQNIDIVVYRLDDALNMGSRKRLGVFNASVFNGVFRISLPMYMDYYIIDEFGEIIPTNDKEKGIPTKGYYAFEIYDKDDRWNGRREVAGGFLNKLIPGIRIPSTVNGDPNLGGWEGTWRGLFEYDLINRKRKFYTIKSIHRKSSIDNMLLSGPFVPYFPNFNSSKSEYYWNFPLSYNNLNNIDTPTIIGSALIPRFTTSLDGTNFNRPFLFLSEPLKDASESFNQQINDWEMYFGLGVGIENGKNSGDSFINIFSGQDFIDINGNNIFGVLPTWNYGDNSDGSFIPSLYSTTLIRRFPEQGNGFVLNPYNQAESDVRTYGVFINSYEGDLKEPLIEFLIHDVTDDLPLLITDGVYSSYKKGDVSTRLSSLNDSLTEITVATTTNTENNNDPNSYNGQYYYFGMWKDMNALYNIEKNYFII